MFSQELLTEIKASKIIVRPGRYAYLKAQEAVDLGKHFFVSQDEDEVTVVTEEEYVKEVSFSDRVEWFKLLEIRVSKPFLVKGFLAAISKTVADADLNVLIISTFSKDYVLLREESVEEGLKALEGLGFQINK